MAKLYFRHGAMGSSKSANALMVEYNYYERGKRALLLKPRVDNRDGEKVIRSRSGLSHSCGYVEDFVKMPDEKIREYDCVIVDEAQFCRKSDIEFFLHVVDHLGVPVICYGLRTDFRRELFEGAMWLLAWADVIEEIRTVCWCGQGACCNARISEDGQIVRSGEQVVLGGNDKYIALCRKHYELGDLGTAWKFGLVMPRDENGEDIVMDPGTRKNDDRPEEPEAEDPGIRRFSEDGDDDIFAEDPGTRKYTEEEDGSRMVSAQDPGTRKYTEEEDSDRRIPARDPSTRKYDRSAEDDGAAKVEDPGIRRIADADVFEITDPGARRREESVPSDPLKDFEADLAKTLEEARESDFDEDDEIDPDLLAFLDASTYTEKLDIFKKMKSHVDDEMVNTIAMSLDTEVAKGDLEKRISEIERWLKTQEKYECTRLR